MWRDRPLEAEAHPYLFVDTRYEKLRVYGRVVGQSVPIVAAVRDEEGYREVLAVGVAGIESEATYHELFESSKARGIGDIVLLVVSDDTRGQR